VHRTKWSWIVEKRLPFRIVSPECDWNFNHNRYGLNCIHAPSSLDELMILAYRYDPWATIGPDMVDLSAPSPFLPEKRVYSRTRVVGKPGFPGKGMGGTLILAGPDEYHPLAEFTFGNDYTYSFRPERIDHGMEDGELYPTHFAYTSRYGSYRKLSGGAKVLQSTPVADVFANKPPTFKLGAQTIAVKLKANINRKVRQMQAASEAQQPEVLQNARQDKAFGSRAAIFEVSSSDIPVQVDPVQRAFGARSKRIDRVGNQLPTAPINS